MRGITSGIMKSFKEKGYAGLGFKISDPYLD
jgi:hypothetical protein